MPTKLPLLGNTAHNISNKIKAVLISSTLLIFLAHGFLFTARHLRLIHEEKYKNLRKFDDHDHI